MDELQFRHEAAEEEEGGKDGEGEREYGADLKRFFEGLLIELLLCVAVVF